MNFIKKFFNKKKIFSTEEKIFSQLNNSKKENKIKKYSKYFLYGIIMIFLSIFFIFSIGIYSTLGDFKKFFFNIPSITGFFGEKNYLVLMLNNSEIRPGGGFISSYAEINFFMGIPNIKIKNSYDIGNPNPLIEPPYPYNKLLGTDIKNYKGWVFRDANLSPDFPTNVQNIVSLYEKGNKKISSLDGIFSIDMNFLKSLLKISGEIEVNGKKFNKNNFFYQTQILSKDFDLHSIEDLNNRKNFLKPLIKNIFSEIKKNPNKGKNLLNEIKILADTKHIQVFFSDKNLQEKIENLGWSGKFSPKGEDFIHINISNIGGRKADRYIRKNYFYDIDFTGNEPIGELKIITKHLGTNSLISDFYQGYYKIYLPKGVEILETKTNFKDKIRIENGENSELRSTVIGGLVHMQPGEETNIIIKYKLPRIVKSEDYKLHLITQAGGEGENWNISIKEKTDNLWGGNNLNDFNIKENIAFFEGKIFKDKILNLKNLGDTTPPVIVWQKFIENNLIEINFSEKISENFLTNKKNFYIENINNPSKKINIKKTYIKGNNLYLEIENEKGEFKYKKGEFYKLLIQNIQDINGNYTSRNPIKITVVQN